MPSTLEKALNISNKVRDIETIKSLIEWDLEITSPKGAQDGKGRQMATMSFLKKIFLEQEETENIITKALEIEEISQNEHDIVASILDEIKEIKKIPSYVEEEFQNATVKSNIAWLEAREKEDFDIWAPHFKDLIEKTKRRASYFKESKQTIYEAILSENEPVFSLNELEETFDEIKSFLIPLIEEIKAKKTRIKEISPTICEQKQFEFNQTLANKLGFDFNNGRLDLSIHPFTTRCGENDVRITTAVEDDNFFSAIYSTIHEFGHGLYEQNMSLKHSGTVLAECPSSALHEAQARVFEVNIGKSKEFLEYLLFLLKEEFEEFKTVKVDDLYKSVNMLNNETIRHEADDLSYDLHIAIRFEIEKELFNGEIEVEEIPSRWAEKSKMFFGIEPSLIEGCLQDIHWGQGIFGYFQSYTIGNIYASQLINAYEKFNPYFWTDVSKGNLNSFKEWLKINVHQKGYTRGVNEILEEATGEEFNISYYKNFLEKKYKEIYELSSFL